ncbi:hypothetical protein B0H10DRAFT_1953202 [Mycena sp. CBHHK59/15]|nr:hypothetical protein B0H10DRAFT_1953202 [Mycena sp. CBHHK59/15]
MSEETQLCDPVEGCGGTFPRKTSPGLCSRCAAIKNAPNPEAADKLQEVAQCVLCGKFGKNLNPARCVTCARQGVEDTELQARENAERAKTTAIQVRSQAWQMRSGGGSQAVAGSQQSRSSLQSREGSTMRHINVHALPFVKKHEYTKLGAMVEDIMKVWAAPWDSSHNASLQRSEIFIVWRNNLNVHEHSMDGTLGEFYDIHSQLYNSEVFLTIPKKYKGLVKSPAVMLNFLIDIEAFQKRTGTKGTRTTMVKRRRNAELDDDEEPMPKRRGLESVTLALTSNFMGIKVPARTRPACDVTLEFENIKTADSTPVFPWSGPSTVQARLYDEPLHTGKDKVVFELEIAGELFVAKRCVDLPTDAASFAAAYRLLSANVYALWNTKYMLSNFYEAVESADIIGDVDPNLAVHDTFLAAEVLGDTSIPSVASGLLDDQLKLAEDELEDGQDIVAPWWLIQRRTATSCQRWNLIDSAKLPSTQNKIGSTVAAISHNSASLIAKSAAATNSELHVLSHFQTVVGKLPTKDLGKLIIDVVYQNDQKAEPRKFSLDQGPRGVKSVVKAHECSRVCHLLGLDKEDGRRRQHRRPDARSTRAPHRAAAHHAQPFDSDSKCAAGGLLVRVPVAVAGRLVPAAVAGRGCGSSHAEMSREVYAGGGFGLGDGVSAGRTLALAPALLLAGSAEAETGGTMCRLSRMGLRGMNPRRSWLSGSTIMFPLQVPVPFPSPIPIPAPAAAPASGCKTAQAGPPRVGNELVVVPTSSGLVERFNAGFDCDHRGLALAGPDEEWATGNKQTYWWLDLDIWHTGRGDRAVEARLDPCDGGARACGGWVVEIILSLGLRGRQRLLLAAMEITSACDWTGGQTAPFTAPFFPRDPYRTLRSKLPRERPVLDGLLLGLHTHLVNIIDNLLRPEGLVLRHVELEFAQAQLFRHFCDRVPQLVAVLHDRAQVPEGLRRSGAEGLLVVLVVGVLRVHSLTKDVRGGRRDRW